MYKTEKGGSSLLKRKRLVVVALIAVVIVTGLLTVFASDFGSRNYAVTAGNPKWDSKYDYWSSDSWIYNGRWKNVPNNSNTGTFKLKAKGSGLIDATVITKRDARDFDDKYVEIKNVLLYYSTVERGSGDISGVLSLTQY